MSENYPDFDASFQPLDEAWQDLLEAKHVVDEFEKSGGVPEPASRAWQNTHMIGGTTMRETLEIIVNISIVIGIIGWILVMASSPIRDRRYRTGFKNNEKVNETLASTGWNMVWIALSIFGVSILIGSVGTLIGGDW